MRIWICALSLIFSYQSNASEVVPGEFLIQFKKNMRFVSQQNTLRTISTKPFEEVSKSTGVYLIKRSTKESLETSLKKLSRYQGIAHVEPNRTWRLRRHANDPIFPYLWALQNTGQTTSGDTPGITGVAGVDIDAVNAWNITTGDKNIKVAVIDTGVNYNHVDLKENIWVNDKEKNGVPGIDDDSNGCVDDIHGCNFVDKTGDPMDDEGHGTHVAGTLGASANNRVGLVGVAWNVTLVPIKFISDQDYGTTDDAIRSIDYAIAVGAKILSNSWGDEESSEFLKQAIERSRDAGTLFIAAAGNESEDNDVIPDYPTDYQIDNIISVAAVDNTGDLASFSNYGKTKVHIAAPGSNIISTYWDPKAPLAYDSESGTSMACPHVSGVAVLMLAKNPNLTYKKLKKIILDSARPMPGLKDKVLSNGMLNAYEALKMVP